MLQYFLPSSSNCLRKLTALFLALFCTLQRNKFHSFSLPQLSIPISQSPPFCHGIRSCRRKLKGKAKNADAGHGGARVGYGTVPAPGLLQRVMRGSPSFLRDMARYFKSGEGALLGKDYSLQVLCERHQLSCRRCSAISRGLQYHIYKLVFPSPLLWTPWGSPGGAAAPRCPAGGTAALTLVLGGAEGCGHPPALELARSLICAYFKVWGSHKSFHIWDRL